MNFLLHLAVVVVLDYVLFQFWFVFANRYTVMNFHEQAFLPARYIIAGVVGGALLHWVYLGVVMGLRALNRTYQHPRWWTLFIAAGAISGIQVYSIVRNLGSPPLSIWEGLALVAHLQLFHLITFYTGERAARDPRKIAFVGVLAGVICMGLWLFWLWYSFEVQAEGDPAPIIGSDAERYVMWGLLLVGVMLGLIYLLRLDVPLISREWVVIPNLNITIRELVESFYSAWALFYLVIPTGHYLLRGYITAHSNLFPAFLPGMLIPLLWTLGWMPVLIALYRPDLRLRLPRPDFEAMLGQRWR